MQVSHVSESASTARSAVFIFPCSGVGWSSVDPAYALELQSRAAEGEFWLDESEFLSQFNDVTVGYPITNEGHLRSIYTGKFLSFSKNEWNLLSVNSMAHY